MAESNFWRTISFRLLTTLRLLFLTSLVWDFFLTVVVQASQRSKVLLDIGEVFSPFIIVTWIFVIFSLLSVLQVTDDSAAHSKLKNRVAIVSLSTTIFLYTGLAILAMVNPLVAWPLIMNYIMNIAWAAALIYFRYKFSKGFVAA